MSTILIRHYNERLQVNDAWVDTGQFYDSMPPAWHGGGDEGGNSYEAGLVQTMGQLNFIYIYN